MTNNINVIRPGAILIHERAVLPDGVRFQTQPFAPGWQIVLDGTSDEVDRAITKAGWHFFYLAEELERAAIARSAETAVRKAVQRLAWEMEQERKNAFEITDVHVRRILGFYYVRLEAHARHVKKTLFLFDDLDDSRAFSQPSEMARAQAA